MANNKSIQILRGAASYDPATSEEVLLDGQPFYSKQTQALYIGDGISKLKNQYSVNHLTITNDADTDDGRSTHNIVYQSSYSVPYKKSDGTEAESKEANSASGKDNVVFGAQNTTNGSRNLLAGKLNENTGSNNLITGLRNNISSNHNVVGGQNNTCNKGGNDNLIGGLQNTVKSGDNIVAGHENNISESGKSNIVAGEQNILGKVINSIICGDNDNIGIEQLIGGIKVGLDILNNSDIQGKALFGYYNKPKTNTLVEVGNGTGPSSGLRKNAFEVLQDGRAKVQSAPVDDDDVARKQDVQNGSLLNIKNGEGLDSIVQTYSSEVDATHYESSTTGESDVCLGEANTSSGKRNLITGKLNQNTGSNNLITGLQNNISSSHNVVGGQNNTNSSGNSNLIVGQNNKVNSPNNIVAGKENTVTINGQSNLIVGEQNVLGRVTNSIICGDNNNIEIEQLIGGIKAGLDLLNNSDIQGKALFGQYNKPKTNTLLEVGNGTGPSAGLRKNALEVLKDGRVKVQTAPIDDDDVIRKQELDTKLNSSSVVQTTGQNISKVMSQKSVTDELGKKANQSDIIGSGMQGSGNPPLQGYNKEKGTIEERLAIKMHDLSYWSEAGSYLSYPRSFVYTVISSSTQKKYDCFYSSGKLYYISDGTIKEVTGDVAWNNYVTVYYMDS